MNSEDNLRKSLQDKLATKDFAFDEANWDKARAMIDDARKPRRLVPFFLAGAALLIALLTGAYFLSGSGVSAPKHEQVSHTDEATSQSVANNKAPATPEVASPAATLPKVTARPNAPETHALKTKDTQVTKAPDETPVITKTAPVVTTKPKQVKPIATDKTPATEQKQEPVLAVTPSTKENPVIKEAPVAEETPANTPETPVTTQPEPIAEKNPTTPFEEKQTEKTEMPSVEKFATDLSSPAVKEMEEPPAAAKTEQALNEAAPAKEPAGDSLSVPVAQAKPDSALFDNDKGELGKPKRFKIIASVEAGATYMFGWKNPGRADATGFNPAFGVNCFLNHLSPKTSVSFGLHYFEISNLSYSSYTSKVIRLSFGEEVKTTVFTPVKAHYLMVPLRLNYNLTPMNTIGAGCNVSYLLDVSSEVETYTEKFNARFDETKHKARGYTEGFKKYDAQISVFYNRRFYPCLGLNLEVFYGLTDVKDNALFGSNVFERNSGVKLTLVYNFLRK